MLLIADSGSTKTDWRIVQRGETVKQILTAGINPYFQSQEEIEEELNGVLFPAIDEEIRAVYFYGAGCAFEEKRRMLAEVLDVGLGKPVEVYSDLMAAARSLCQHRPGIACILGTGSNSCLYDGVEIIGHTPPLGFILGDEGSGAVLGKILVNACLKKQLPGEICRKFLEAHELTTENILERVYRQPFPNRFLANLSRFLLENIEEEPIRNLVLISFQDFLVKNVKPYKSSDKYPIHFTGSIAYFYQGLLREAAIAVGLHPGIICQSPMEGLIRYHTLPKE